ncbi:hypothetical protein J4230_05355 [Candidatus Woesearchaeota archaeon]|nr:hypothetical protein [Candidatus Woesearchaeota archaeon]
MGFLDTIKNRFIYSNNRINEEEIHSYLRSSKDSLKSAYENIGKFLEAMRDFQPARRHEPLYYEQVKERLVSMRSGINKGIIFIDERMNNTINTLNAIKNPDQLRDLISGWTKNIQANDEKVYDILKILQIEMWGDDKIKRGFPVPMNKDMVCGYLINAVNYLYQARSNLDSYISYSSMTNAA